MKIDVINVSKKYKDKTILNNINLTFEEGFIYGLVGPNGAGKSIFLKLLCGFYQPTSGSIIFDNEKITKNNAYKFNIRALIDKPCFFADMTGYENLELLSKICNKIDKKDIINTLDLVNLLEEKDKKYSLYSLGMKQKLGIAQVFMENPKIMILDEPFNGVDKQSIEKIKNYIKNIKKDKIIIITSHVENDLDSLVDKIISFDNGIVNN